MFSPWILDQMKPFLDRVAKDKSNSEEFVNTVLDTF